MDASEARDHVEMIEKIIASSSCKLEAGGEFFLVWGLLSGTINILSQLYLNGRLPLNALWGSLALVIIGVIFTAARMGYYRARGDRMSLLQREFLNILWLALGLAFLTDAIGFNLFAAWGQAAIWSVMAALVLFYIGMHGNRRAMLGGIVLIASIAAANFMLPSAGYILAAGMYIGYAGFGLAEFLARE